MSRIFEAFNVAARDMRGSEIRSVDAIKCYDYFILGHVTSTALLDSISKNGLLPPCETNRRIKDNLNSDPDSVYLLSRMDNYYAKRAIGEFGGEGLVVICRVATDKLLPDENTLFLQQKDDTLLNQLFYSLCFGQCKHTGPIDVEQILGFYSLDGL